MPVVRDLSAIWVTPNWLPDGSGLVFTQGSFLFRCVFGSVEAIPLARP
jgi:hypothetical protein